MAGGSIQTIQPPAIPIDLSTAFTQPKKATFHPILVYIIYLEQRAERRDLVRAAFRGV